MRDQRVDVYLVLKSTRHSQCAVVRVSPSWVRESQFLHLLAKVCCCQSCFILVVLLRVSFGFNLDFPDEQWCRTLFGVKAAMSMACSDLKWCILKEQAPGCWECHCRVPLYRREVGYLLVSEHSYQCIYIVSTFLNLSGLKTIFKFLVLSFDIWIKIRQNVGNVQVDRMLLYHLPVCWKTTFSAVYTCLLNNYYNKKAETTFRNTYKFTLFIQFRVRCEMPVL